MTYSDLKQADYDLNTELFSWGYEISKSIEEAKNLIEKSRTSNSVELQERREKFTKEIENLSSQLPEYETYGDMDDINRYLKSAQRLQSKLDNLSEKVKTLNTDEALFGLEPKPLPNLQETITHFTPYLQLYQVATEFEKLHDSWMNGSFLQLNPETIESEVSNMWKSIYKLNAHFEGNSAPVSIAVDVKSRIETFKKHIPLITVLCNPGIRDRHWKQISDIVGFKFQPDETTSLGLVLERNLALYLDKIDQVSAVASKEHSFEKALQKMRTEWSGVCFNVLEYRDTGTYILSGIDDIQTLLDDHIVKTQTMRGSPFIKAFDQEAREWDEKLLLIQDILDEWLKVQATWLYLEPIFSSEDIMRQMPSEGKRFISVNKTWKELMAQTFAEKEVLKVCSKDDLLTSLKVSNTDLEIIQKGLNHYLEVKRLYFPRFFFLSNDEMLEILSETRDPKRVQPHLKKCFEGVDSLEFDQLLDILGMYSAQKEFVKFSAKISTEKAGGAVEKWLLEVEKMMIESMRRVVEEAYIDYQKNSREKWVLQWPGQVVLNVSQVFWTTEVEGALTSNDPKALKKYLEVSTEKMGRIIELIRGNLSKLSRSTLEALVVVSLF